VTEFLGTSRGTAKQKIKQKINFPKQKKEKIRERHQSNNQTIKQSNDQTNKRGVRKKRRTEHRMLLENDFVEGEGSKCALDEEAAVSESSDEEPEEKEASKPEKGGKSLRWFAWRPTSLSYWGYLVYLLATLSFFVGSAFSIGFCRKATDLYCISTQKKVLVDWVYFVGALSFFVGALLFFLSLAKEIRRRTNGTSLLCFYMWKPRCPIYQSCITALLAGSLYLVSAILGRIDYFSSTLKINRLGPSLVFLVGTIFLLLANIITAVKLWRTTSHFFTKLPCWSVLLRVVGAILFLAGGIASYFPDVGDVFTLVAIKIPFLVGSLLFFTGVYLALFWTINYACRQGEGDQEIEKK